MGLPSWVWANLGMGLPSWVWANLGIWAWVWACQAGYGQTWVYGPGYGPAKLGMGKPGYMGLPRVAALTFYVRTHARKLGIYGTII